MLGEEEEIWGEVDLLVLLAVPFLALKEGRVEGCCPVYQMGWTLWWWMEGQGGQALGQGPAGGVGGCIQERKHPKISAKKL